MCRPKRTPRVWISPTAISGHVLAINPPFVGAAPYVHPKTTRKGSVTGAHTPVRPSTGVRRTLPLRWRMAGTRALPKITGKLEPFSRPDKNVCGRNARIP